MIISIIVNFPGLKYEQLNSCVDLASRRLFIDTRKTSLARALQFLNHIGIIPIRCHKSNCTNCHIGSIYCDDAVCKWIYKVDIKNYVDVMGIYTSNFENCVENYEHLQKRKPELFTDRYLCTNACGACDVL
jgi:hypothetical protein